MKCTISENIGGIASVSVTFEDGEQTYRLRMHQGWEEYKTLKQICQVLDDIKEAFIKISDITNLTLPTKETDECY